MEIEINLFFFFSTKSQFISTMDGTEFTFRTDHGKKKKECEKGKSSGINLDRMPEDLVYHLTNSIRPSAQVEGTDHFDQVREAAARSVQRKRESMLKKFRLTLRSPSRSQASRIEIRHFETWLPYAKLPIDDGILSFYKM